MKKNIIIVFTLLFTSFFVTSCLNDKPTSNATVNYFGMPDSIKFSDLNDTVWETNIYEAMAKLGIYATPFEMSDTAYSGVDTDPVTKCDLKAGDKFDKMLKATNLSGIKKQIFNLHADSLIQLGYKDGAEALPIDKFTIYSSLWSTYYGIKIFKYENTIQ